MNKFHALFTDCQCLSPCVSNLAVALSALNATIVVQRGRKAVPLPIAKLYDAAWSNAKVHNSLEPADLILRVEVPVTAGGRSAYLQLAEKSDFDWALVSCAVAGRLEGGRLRGVRIALGAVAPIPWQVEAAGKFLEGREPTDENAAQAADLVLRDAAPHEHNGYKIPQARALIRRAVRKLSA